MEWLAGRAVGLPGWDAAVLLGGSEVAEAAQEYIAQQAFPGRDFPTDAGATVDDVRAIAMPALRHRVAANYTALAEGITSEKIIEMLMDHIPADKEFDVPAA